MKIKVSKRNDIIYISGYQEDSLVDVLESVSFTVWFSYCNLYCPWCSNYQVARGKNARGVKINQIVERVKEVVSFVDYFHVTGGEPTLQLNALKNLLEEVKKETGLLLSIDTNGTIPIAVKKLQPLLNHIAIDVKAPLSDPKIYAKATGISEKAAQILVRNIIKSIEYSKQIPFLELRTTVIPNIINQKVIKQIAKDLLPIVSEKGNRITFIVQQFIPYEGIGDPFYKHIRRTPPEIIREYGEIIKEILPIETYIRTLEDGTKKIT